MPLYFVKVEATVCVVAESAASALEKAIGVVHKDTSIPAFGSARPLPRPHRIPEDWQERRPAGAPADDPRLCRDHVTRTRRRS